MSWALVGRASAVSPGAASLHSLAKGCLRFAIGEVATEEGLGVVRAEDPWPHSDLRVRVLGDLPKKSQVWLAANIICSLGEQIPDPGNLDWHRASLAAAG